MADITRQLPPRMEVMQRATPRADVEPVRRGNRRADIDFGLARCLVERESLGQTRGNGRSKRATGAVGLARLDAGGGEAEATIGLDEKIDALRPVAVSAFDQYCSRAKCQQFLALGTHFVFIARG